MIQLPTFQPITHPYPFSYYSVSFDASDDYADPGLDFGSIFQGTFSISCWLKYTSDSGTQMIFAADSQVGGDNNRVNIYRAVGETRMFMTAEGTASTINGWTHGPGTGKHHYLFVFRQDGADVDQEMYVNGTLRASNTTSTMDMSDYGTSTQKAKPYIGARNTGDASNTAEFFFNGNIDDFMIVGSDLSASASAIYNSGTPGDLSSYSPYGWWRMGDDDGGTGSTITDKGSGGNNLSLQGGAAIQAV